MKRMLGWLLGYVTNNFSWGSIVWLTNMTIIFKYEAEQSQLVWSIENGKITISSHNAIMCHVEIGKENVL
jgi:hypothetical protein